MPNSIWNRGEPTESTTLLGQDANNSDEQESGSNVGLPSAANYAPPGATTLWGSPSQRTTTSSIPVRTPMRSPLLVPKTSTGQTCPPLMAQLRGTYAQAIIAPKGGG
eukprot:9483055-Pyramimonas_sp.AAC.1